MPLQHFDGQTWVAFSDLCGTKAMYLEDPDTASTALSRFYNTVYSLHDRCSSISAFAVSDCAVSWVHSGGCRGNEAEVPAETLESLLQRLQCLHRKLIDAGHLVSSTVAYGHFTYEARQERIHLRKGMMIGSAYLDAYGHNASLRPGAIGIVKAPPPHTCGECAGRFANFLIQRRGAVPWEFVWWADGPAQVHSAKQRVDRAFKNRFKAVAKAYRNRSRS